MEQDDKYVFRPAKDEEIEYVFNLINERIHWMDKMGINQWNKIDYWKYYPASYFYIACSEKRLYKLKDECFEKVNLNLFSAEPSLAKYNTEISPRENMKKIIDISKTFINNFESPDQKNLLFTGTPGVGKTFMSSCIANEIINKNYTVLYQTSSLLLNSIFEYKFSKEENSKELYDNLFNVNLLIIDDLGTENLTAAKFEELFTILNSRLITPGTKTIISTNLSLEDLARTYDHRILSRLMGNFIVLRFYGDDIRLIKH